MTQLASLEHLLVMLSRQKKEMVDGNYWCCYMMEKVGFSQLVKNDQPKTQNYRLENIFEFLLYYYFIT